MALPPEVRQRATCRITNGRKWWKSGSFCRATLNRRERNLAQNKTTSRRLEQDVQNVVEHKQQRHSTLKREISESVFGCMCLPFSILRRLTLIHVHFYMNSNEHKHYACFLYTKLFSNCMCLSSCSTYGIRNSTPSFNQVYASLYLPLSLLLMLLFSCIRLKISFLLSFTL